ncbi:MAG: hypothetical protein PHV03_07070 [Desulfitobacteriaceae bacterium]|nr:hypothetical protein [Desulfitobacteriaceae bacterium]MDD4401702.1 hypothetical protein [Desulfitobacteriaceae bacterium]
MKKVWIVISLAVIVALFIIFNTSIIPTHSTGNTIEEAIRKSGRNVTEIVHTEEVKDGVVVFYKKNIGSEGESNASGYIKKTIWGWEWSYGGEHSDSIGNGFSTQYFPYSKDTPFPLLFGEIKDQKIKQIIILKIDQENDSEAKIIGTNSDIMWFTFLDKSEGPRFTIIGLSGEGTTLYSETININDNFSKGTTTRIN